MTLPFIAMTGGLVDDVELRFTPGGKAVANSARQQEARQGQHGPVDGRRSDLPVGAVLGACRRERCRDPEAQGGRSP